MLKNKKILAAVSIIIAVGMWIYVMGTVDPEEKVFLSEVSVELSGEDTLEDLDLSASLEGPKVISVTISGKRSDVYKVKKKGLRAYVDVSTCEYGRNKGKIEIEKPDEASGIVIDSMSDEYAVFTVR